MTDDRCDKCRAKLAPPDPRDRDDRGPRCAACVLEYGPAPFNGQLALDVAGR